MAKPYFAEYCNHILRFYFKYDSKKGFKNKVDKLNYESAEQVISALPVKSQEIMYNIFSQKEYNIAKCVATVAYTDRIDEGELWRLIGTVTNKIAKKRGLI